MNNRGLLAVVLASAWRGPELIWKYCFHFSYHMSPSLKQPKRFELLRPGLRMGRFLACIAALGLSTPSPAGALEDIGKRLGLSKKPEFPIQESGYWTCERGHGQCIYWLDNERVIFNGAKPGDIETLSDGRQVSKHAIYVWDLKTNAVTKHADAERGILCYVDGHIRYSRTKDNDVVIIAGPIGKEIETERRKKGEQRKVSPENHGWNTELSCGRYQPQIPSPLPGLKVALKEGHGFLHFGTGNSSAEKRESVSYFLGSLNAEIKLPVARWKLSPPRVARNDFDDSYLLSGPYRENESSGINTCPKTIVERTIYRLTVDGSLTSISIPADPKLRCYVSRFAVLRAGILVQMQAGHVTDLDRSVMYLLRSGKINEVIRGVTTDRAVSPNGCLLAVAISSNRDPLKPTTAATYRGHLKVINFCTEGGT